MRPPPLPRHLLWLQIRTTTTKPNDHPFLLLTLDTPLNSSSSTQLLPLHNHRLRHLPLLLTFSLRRISSGLRLRLRLRGGFIRINLSLSSPLSYASSSSSLYSAASSSAESVSYPPTHQNASLPPRSPRMLVASPHMSQSFSGPSELLRENKRMLDRSIRDIERERQGLQAQEKKLIAEIKKSAKQGQMGAVGVMAKDLIRI